MLILNLCGHLHTSTQYSCSGQALQIKSPLFLNTTQWPLFRNRKLETRRSRSGTNHILSECNFVGICTLNVYPWVYPGGPDGVPAGPSDCKSWVPLVLYYIANSVSLWIARFDASFQSDTLEFSPGPLVLLGIYIVENKHPVFNTSTISDSGPSPGGFVFSRTVGLVKTYTSYLVLV